MSTEFYTAETHIFQNPNGSNVYIKPQEGQNLFIEGYEPPVPEKIEVNAMSDDLGLNELSQNQLLPQNTSGNFEAQGISVSISSESSTPVRIVCGAPKNNTGGSSYGGSLLYTSTAGADFIGPVSFQASTFCDDFVGLHSYVSDDGNFFTMSYAGSPNYVRVYKWNGSTYATPQNINFFTQGKISSNYLLLTDESGDLSVFFHNGSTWSLQQQITSNPVTLYEIHGNQLYYVFEGTLYIYSRSGVTWTQLATVSLGLGMDQVVNQLSVNSSGTLICVLIDNTILKIYESLALVKTITESYIISICNNDTLVFYNDGSYISIVSKVANVWTKSTNKTALDFIDKLACNNTRLVCGRSVVNTYGRLNVFHINAYTNQLVLANEVSTDNSYNLNVTSHYKDVNISATNVNITSDSQGAVFVNGSADISGNLDIGGTLNFTQLQAGDGSASVPAINFANDQDTGIYSSGDGNFDISINSVNKFALTSDSLTIPKVVTSGPFFKLNMYSQTQVQSFLSAVSNAVEFGNTMLEENSGITRSSITYPSAPNAGSRFTNVSGKTLRILACYNITSNSGTNARTDVNFNVSLYPGIPLGRVTRDENNVGFSFGSSAMFVLGHNDYFEVSFICVPNLAISTNTTSGAYLQVYSLA